MALSEDSEQKVIKQVEFYFSDSNAPRDKFLLGKIQEHPEGYVELAIVCAFSRMLSLLNLPPNQKPEEIPNAVIKKVADALSKSEALEVSEEKDHVRRAQPLKESAEMMKELDERTVYFHPLPFDCTLDSLTQFFNTVGPVRCVRMRRHPNSKDFRGSVFVEFETKEIAEEVVREREVVYEGAPQHREMKQDFIDRKYRAYQVRVGSGNAAEGAGKRKRDESDVDGPSPSKPKLELSSPPGVFTPGLAIKFILPREVAADEQLRFADVKSALGGRDSGVGHVEYTPGKLVGFARMYNKDKVQELLAKSVNNGKMEVELGGRKLLVELDLLEGAEERQFHDRAEAKRKAALAAKSPGGGDFHVDKRNSFGRGGGGGRMRGGRGRFGRRGRVI